MEREFITHHIKKDYSELEHLTASSAKKYSQDYSKHSWSTRRAPEVLDACTTRLRRARGLVRPNAARLLIECSRIRNIT